jgi:SSS family solute:Na+ symporter
MVNVTSSVVTNDFLKRYFTKNLGQKQLVRLGQIASIFAITLAFIFSLYFKDIVSAWETMIFVVVTMILAPATMRWHWWRFSAKAFVWSMIFSAVVILVQKLFFNSWSAQLSLSFDTISSVIISLISGFVFKPTNMETLLKFYSRVRPFGFWKPIRLEAEKRGLIPVKDSMPKYDVLNGFLTVIFQVSLALIPFFLFLRQWKNMIAWVFVFAIMGVFLYFTWYKKLPSPEEV